MSSAITPPPGSQAWLDQVVEVIVEPDLEIVDPHHHLWPAGGALPYGPQELRTDTASGHRVTRSVFVECGAAHRPDGPEHLRPVGETSFVAAASVQTRSIGGPEIAGIVANGDLRLEPGMLAELLDAHEEAGAGLFRGIRHAAARDPHPEVLRIPGRAPDGLFHDPDFRRGVRALGERGLTYDSWHYHHQNQDFLALAQACPDTVMVLDHFGTPLGVGPYAAERESIFETWQRDIAALGACENVVAKLGGLAMPDNGFGWDQASRPPTSDELVAAQGRWYHHTIDCFGPERVMFESNFPVDRFSLSYPVFWNAAKKLCAAYSTDERSAMLAGTASRVYRI